MNKKAQTGMAFLIVAFLFILTAFALIPIFKENLDNSRGSSSTLNCPGTPTHDATDYQNDTKAQKLIRRPACFVTGISMVWFIFAFVIAVVVWAFKNFRRKRT